MNILFLASTLLATVTGLECMLWFPFSEYISGGTEGGRRREWRLSTFIY